jgi:hypothetical protein
MKKHHFDAFQHEKHFEKQSQPHSQTGPKLSHLYDPGHEILLAYTVCWFFWIFLISFFLHWICCVLGFIFFFFAFYWCHGLMFWVADLTCVLGLTLLPFFQFYSFALSWLGIELFHLFSFGWRYFFSSSHERWFFFFLNLVN